MNLGREVTPALKKLLTIGGDEAHIIVNQIMVLGLGVLVTEKVQPLTPLAVSEHTLD